MASLTASLAEAQDALRVTKSQAEEAVIQANHKLERARNVEQELNIEVARLRTQEEKVFCLFLFFLIVSQCLSF